MVEATPSQMQSVTAPVPNYTAWWQRHRGGVRYPRCGDLTLLLTSTAACHCSHFFPILTRGPNRINSVFDRLGKITGRTEFNDVCWNCCVRYTVYVARQWSHDSTVTSNSVLFSWTRTKTRTNMIGLFSRRTRTRTKMTLRTRFEQELRNNAPELYKN